MGVTARLATAFALTVLLPLSAGPAVAAMAPPLELGRAAPPLLSASAASGDSPAIDALVALQAEVLVLVELGAFTSVPPSLAAVHDTYRSYVAGIDRAGLLSWLGGSDADGTEALGRLAGTGATLHDKTVTALKPLPDEAWTALAEGRTIAMPPTVYVAALDQLEALADAGPASDPTGSTVTLINPTPPSNAPTPTTAPTPATTVPPSTVPISTTPGGPAGPEPTASTVPNRSGSTAANPVPASGIGGSTPTSASAPADNGPTVRPSTTRSPATTAAAGSTTTGDSAAADSASAERADLQGDDAREVTGSDSGGGGVPLGLLLALAGVLAAIGLTTGLLVMSRRRNRPSDGLDAVLEAGRQLASVLDLAQLYPTMLGQARSLLGANHAAYLARGGGIDPTADTEGPTGFDAAARASLDRVLETGQSWLGTLHWHGAERGPAAVLATAVTGGGQVQGVLVVRRGADRPFQRHDQARLERLAPFVAAALSAAARHQALTDLTFTDALTNLANRRQLDDHVAAAANGAGGETIGFAMIDVDHFKAYNDTHGHPAGDALLRQLAAVLAANVRPGDVVYRYGGEEFAILLPGADQRVAAEVGERVRDAIHRADLPGGSSQPNGRVTVSVGIAVGPTEAAESLKGQADQSLYEAKRNGRDRVVVAPARP